MNLVDTSKLLAVIATVDRRTVGETDIVAWHDLLEDVTLDDALTAVREHRRESAEWIQPAHIVARVRKIRALRLDKAGNEAFPNDIEGVAYTDELRALRKAIGDGRMTAADLAAYHASGRSIFLQDTRGIVAGARVVRGEIA